MPTPRWEWEADCMRWRGELLVGKFSHWCMEWDGLPIDETTPEWPCNCAWADHQTKPETPRSGE